MLSAGWSHLALLYYHLEEPRRGRELLLNRKHRNTGILSEWIKHRIFFGLFCCCWLLLLLFTRAAPCNVITSAVLVYLFLPSSGSRWRRCSNIPSCSTLSRTQPQQQQNSEFFLVAFSRCRCRCGFVLMTLTQFIENIIIIHGDNDFIIYCYQMDGMQERRTKKRVTNAGSRFFFFA